MRVIEQLIGHLRWSGHLTNDQLEQLRQMGLLRDKTNDPARRFEDYWGDEGSRFDDEDEDPALDVTDAWEAFGDRLLEDARRVATGPRRGGGRRAAESDMVAAVERSLATEQGFLALVLEVARRMDPRVVDPCDAARLVSCADPAALDAVLSRDSLWARLWPHIVNEPIVAALDDRTRRRFCRVLASRAVSNKSVRARPPSNAVVQRAVDVIEAHRALSCAFGRVALGADPWRVFCELNLSVESVAYEVMVILFSARGGRRTVAELPHLPGDLGLPTPAWLGFPHFDAGWEIAARIDPVGVLAFMRWCMRAWDAAPASELGWRELIHLDDAGYDGTWTPHTGSEWFSVAVVDSKWRAVRCSIELERSSLVYRGVEYVNLGWRGDKGTVQRFVRPDAPDDGVDVWWSWEIAERPDFARSRCDYGAMWAAKLFEMPLLTCPKQWELR